MAKVKFVCEFCNKEFLEYKSNRVRKHIYCSKDCVDKAKLGHIPWNKGFGEYMRGEKNHFFGKKHTEESLKRISETGKGRKPWNLGIKQWTNKKPPMLGRKQTQLAREKISKALLGKHPWNYAGSLDRTERQIAMAKKDYILWRTAVFMRDDYTCQICNTRGGFIEADHIKSWRDYPELRYAIDNGRTLCRECHLKTPTWGGRSLRYLRKEVDSYVR